MILLAYDITCRCVLVIFLLKGRGGGNIKIGHINTQNDDHDIENNIIISADDFT